MSERPNQSLRHPSSGHVRVPLELPRDVAGEIRRAAGPARAEEAVRCADRALEQLTTGDLTGAVKTAGRAKHLATRSGAVREILALAHYAAGEWREALREMQAYRRMTGRLDQNHVIADCYRALGKPDRAVSEAEAAFAATLPDEVQAECTVVGASALVDLGRYEEALALARRYPTREDVGRSFDLRVWYVTGDILSRLGRTRDAAREFQRILRHDPGAFDVAERLAALA